MKYKQNNKIAIGTAQFSNNYGITNKEFLNFDEIRGIIDDCLKFKVDTIDTAPEYKGVEKKLGKFDLRPFNIITKISLMKNSRIQSSNDLKKIIQSSLSNLKLKKIYAILIRNPTILLEDTKLLEFFVDLKNKNKISKIGYTLYNLEELKELYNFFKPDIVQIPFSIIDKRFEKEEWINRLYNDGIEIHIRSVFLQGLLLSKAKSLPKNFFLYKDFFERFEIWVKKKKISKLQACLNSLLKDDRIAKIIIGINSRQNLNQICNLKRIKLIYPKWLELNNDKLLNPSNW